MERPLLRPRQQNTAPVWKHSLDSFIWLASASPPPKPFPNQTHSKAESWTTTHLQNLPEVRFLLAAKLTNSFSPFSLHQRYQHCISLPSRLQTLDARQSRKSNYSCTKLVIKHLFVTSWTLLKQLKYNLDYRLKLLRDCRENYSNLYKRCKSRAVLTIQQYIFPYTRQIKQFQFNPALQINQLKGSLKQTNI